MTPRRNKETHCIRKQEFLRPFGVIGVEATVEKIKRTTLQSTSETSDNTHAKHCSQSKKIKLD